MPDYPACGKRTLQDNGSWLQTLQRDNVELVRTPIERITPGGVVTEDGVTHDADVIVYATGFRHTDVLWPLKVTGRNGIDLHEMWGSRPYAYLGITVPEFPNFFIVYGPGTHLAHGGSLIFQSELQMRYIDQCLQRLAETDLHSLEPTAEAADRLASTDADRNQEDGVVAPRGQTLVFQERRRRDPHRQPVAPQRVLGRGARARLVTISCATKKVSTPTMRTVVVDGPRSIRVDTRPDPALPGPDGAIVEVTAAGICGSDLHFYEGDFPMPDPIALGHEAVGTVVEVGPDVRTVKVGDQVMVSSVTGCGSCPGCATRDPVMCYSGFQIFGGGVLGGAQADLLAVPAADFQLLQDARRDQHRAGAAAHRQPGHRLGGGAARRHSVRRHRGGDRPGSGRPVLTAQRVFPGRRNGFRCRSSRGPPGSAPPSGAPHRSRRRRSRPSSPPPEAAAPTR